MLGKAPQTINNEIQRGTVLQQIRKGKFEKRYSADYAQQAYETVRKNSGRKAKIDKALEEIKADGTYDKIHSKWFSNN